MPHYELMFIATKEASAVHITSLLKNCGSRLQDTGGMFRRVQHLGLRPLAYRMRAPMTKKWHEMGRYIQINLQASPMGLQEVEKRLKIDDEVIRHLAIKKKHLAPVEMFQKRSKAVAKPEEDLTPELFAYMKRGTNLDYFAARTMLQHGIVNREQMKELQDKQDAVLASFNEEVARKAKELEAEEGMK
mmetsp:Transcript_29285/g.57482  ORF Transcript_29285/g.57482 Transcript_29285/m.57482 type:complete len:188 (-) Transcript_29285:363-926(-)